MSAGARQLLLGLTVFVALTLIGGALVLAAG